MVRDWRKNQDTIKKMKDSKKGHGNGINNSQFGSFWITNGIENKKVKKDIIIPDGWYKGRILKL